MPTAWTQAEWEAIYYFPGHPGDPRADSFGVVKGVPALNVVQSFREKAGTRRDALTGYGLDNNARVGVIGPGTGKLNEYLIDAGIPDTWGIEGSDYLWSDTTHIRPDVLAKMVRAVVGVMPVSEIQGLLKAAGMSNPLRFDWIVDEDAINSCLDDAEILAFLAACEDLLQGNAKGRIIHIVTPAPGSNQAILWKPMTDWKAYAPDHTWVDARTGQVV